MLNAAMCRRAWAATANADGVRTWLAPLSHLQVRQQLLLVGVLAASLVPLLQTRGYIASFVDESDNFLGGFLIAHGAVLYRDYFSHHMPLPYFIAAIASRLGASSIEDYRTFTALSLFAVYTFIVLRFQRRLSRLFLAITIFTLAISHALFLGNMLLAETILSCSVLVLFLYCYAWPELNFPIGDQIVISFVSYTAAMSTLVSAYPLVAFAAFYAWRAIEAGRRTRVVRPARQTLILFAILVLPYALTAAWLIANGLLASFLKQAITFNQVYYSRFDLANNPAAILVHALRSDYHYVRDNLTLANLIGGEGMLLLAGGVAGLLLTKQRGLALGGLYWILLVLSRLRAEPFHDQAYFVLAIVGLGLVLRWAIQQFRADGASVGRFARMIGPGIALAAGVVYYVGLARAYVASSSFIQPDGYVFQFKDAIDAITEPEERIWVGPIDPQAYLAAHRLPASRYAFYLPWLAASSDVNTSFIRDLESTRPPVIIMPLDGALVRLAGAQTRSYVIRNYAQTLSAYLAAEYVPVDAQDVRWKAVFVRRDRSDELRQRLQDLAIYVPRLVGDPSGQSQEGASVW